MTSTSPTPHGLSIGLERWLNQVFLSLKAVGKLTHDDYQSIIPMIDAALHCVNDAKVNVLFETTDFDGWELRTAWDDFNLELKYSNQFAKVAVFGHTRWQEVSFKISSWFTSGEIKYFNDKSEALSWFIKQH